MQRPAPYVPLSVTFATGKTGTAILERFGTEGLGVWAAIIAAAKAGNPEGQIVLLHDNDWGTLGLSANPPSFPLTELLTFLGRRKQTRTTRQGRVMYVKLTRWGDWNATKNSYLAAQRSSRNRQEKKRDAERTESEREANAMRNAEVEVELDIEKALQTSRETWHDTSPTGAGRAGQVCPDCELGGGYHLTDCPRANPQPPVETSPSTKP